MHKFHTMKCFECNWIIKCLKQNFATSTKQNIWRSSYMSLFVGLAWSNVSLEYWGYMNPWPAILTLQVWCLMLFLFWTYHTYHSFIIVNRMILKSLFFLIFIQDENQARFKRLQKAFSDPMTEVYLLFFQAILPTFTTFNLLLQREEASIFLLHDEVQSFCIFVLSSGSLYRSYLLFYTGMCVVDDQVHS